MFGVRHAVNRLSILIGKVRINFIFSCLTIARSIRSCELALIIRPHDLSVLIDHVRKLALVTDEKRPAHPWRYAGAAGLKLSCSFPPPRTQFVSLGLASDHARSRFDDGGGYLWMDKYHMRKVCQDTCTSAHALENGVRKDLFETIELDPP